MMISPNQIVDDNNDRTGPSSQHGPTQTPTILSLDQFEVSLSAEVEEYLASQYDDMATFQRIKTAMKIPPAQTICRVNQILSNRQEVLNHLRNALAGWGEDRGVNPESIQVQHVHGLDDAISIYVAPPEMNMSLVTRRTPLAREVNVQVYPKDEVQLNSPRRRELGWPTTHRAVICDRYCGEAVLRGSDIFVKGILAADSSIRAGEVVAVYADIKPYMGPGTERRKIKPPTRGSAVEDYVGTCIFLGTGLAQYSRSELFRRETGVGIAMSALNRAGPTLPPLNILMQSNNLNRAIMAQNLPSLVVAHALDPQPGDVILDMCCAPGGKTCHVASRVQNQALIVACDKSRKKMIAARSLFSRMGASCIVPLVMDSSKCVNRDDKSSAEALSVSELLDLSSMDKDGQFKCIHGFQQESFDRILLDPPCSALGLRPKLQVDMKTKKELLKHACYQELFIREAVDLLKPGGTMTYSTCTFHVQENEAIVCHVLERYGDVMELLPIYCDYGEPGLPFQGLSDEQRMCVRRFDPGTGRIISRGEMNDTIGFFVAKFRKKPR